MEEHTTHSTQPRFPPERNMDKTQTTDFGQKWNCPNWPKSVMGSWVRGGGGEVRLRISGLKVQSVWCIVFQKRGGGEAQKKRNCHESVTPHLFQEGKKLRSCYKDATTSIVGLETEQAVARRGQLWVLIKFGQTEFGQNWPELVFYCIGQIWPMCSYICC